MLPRRRTGRPLREQPSACARPAAYAVQPADGRVNTRVEARGQGRRRGWPHAARMQTAQVARALPPAHLAEQSKARLSVGDCRRGRCVGWAQRHAAAQEGMERRAASHTDAAAAAIAGGGPSQPAPAAHSIPHLTRRSDGVGGCCSIGGTVCQLRAAPGATLCTIAAPLALLRRLPPFLTGPTPPPPPPPPLGAGPGSRLPLPNFWRRRSERHCRSLCCGLPAAAGRGVAAPPAASGRKAAVGAVLPARLAVGIGSLPAATCSGAAFAGSRRGRALAPCPPAAPLRWAVSWARR